MVCSPNLTWRDVQYLTVSTANPQPLLEYGDFTTNAVGRKCELHILQNYSLEVRKLLSVHPGGWSVVGLLSWWIGEVWTESRSSFTSNNPERTSP